MKIYTKTYYSEDDGLVYGADCEESISIEELGDIVDHFRMIEEYLSQNPKIQKDVEDFINSIKNDNVITRDQFMDAFRSNEFLNSLTPDDRREIFSQVLLGSSDLTKEFLEKVLQDYNVSNIEIIRKK